MNSLIFHGIFKCFKLNRRQFSFQTKFVRKEKSNECPHCLQSGRLVCENVGELVKLQNEQLQKRQTSSTWKLPAACGLHGIFQVGAIAAIIIGVKVGTNHQLPLIFPEFFQIHLINQKVDKHLYIQNINIDKNKITISKIRK